MKPATLLIFVGLSLALSPFKLSAAETECGPRETVLEGLAAGYDEAPVAAGLAENGMLVEVLTATDGTTWTIIASSTDGTACLVASGQSWQAKQLPAGDMGAAARGYRIPAPATELDG